MKCLILAGGKGNSLWPLSRGEYPKQFMSIRRNRSLLQETVARNIPFCNEFLIATNASYSFIVEGQMKAFQGLKYRCILEEEGRKTAPSTAIACMYLNPSELVYVVSADQIIEGSEYKETVMRGRALAKEGQLVTFGMEVLGANTGYGYIRNEGEKVLEFREKPDEAQARRYYESGKYLWNSGNFLFCVGDFLNELKKNARDVYDACEAVHREVRMSSGTVTIPAEQMSRIPAVSIEKAVFERSDRVSVVKASFHWWDIGNLEILSNYMKNEENYHVIAENCGNLTVINQTERQLVVADGVDDLTVVNTEDACYITKKGGMTAVKKIIQEHPAYSSYFEKSRTVYRPWGMYEILNYTSNYKVKKVTVYPGRAMTTHRHSMRSELWSVVQGTATVILDSKVHELPLYSSIEVPIGVEHSLANRSEDVLVIMEVSFGPQVIEEDTEYLVTTPGSIGAAEAFIKCEPVFKDYLWGGTKLRDLYGKNCDYDKIAESWELSAHEDGQCRVASGKYRGMLFGDYLERSGEDALGWKCQAFERCPLLIKFIDAKEQLSVQVHPDDSYALPNENEYGKNEMWYVMDCEPGAFIYFGLKRSISPEELRERAVNNTITEVLNRVPVKKGDTFFVRSGTIHAIGSGILICEIQQNSNCTYRLYDYARRDKFGNLRELHLEQAVAVANTGKQEESVSCAAGPAMEDMTQMDGVTIQKLCECKYFTSSRYEVEESVSVAVNDTSFAALVILEGNGSIRTGEEQMEFQSADTFFIHAGKKQVDINGKCSFILTHL
ncbi:MAG: cupin domain-containing protein [Lachnospiraceae bacterium]|nr:cupin domain-containing protein [Lachnospiraceae bacterium]